MSGHRNDVLQSRFGQVTRLALVAIFVWLAAMVAGGRAYAQTTAGAADRAAMRYVIY